MMPEAGCQETGVVHCGRHGNRREAYVCDHLFSSEGQGFVASVDQPGNPHPDAWCSACDRLRLAHGGVWNEENEALIKVRLVCGECYEEIKANNTVSAPLDHVRDEHI